MRFKVPAYSQFLDVENKDWQGKSCGIVSLKMLFDYWHPKRELKPEDFDDLINEGLAFGGYIPGVGWRHKELAEIARGHGLEGQNFDWTNDHTDIAFNKTIPHLTRHPVMASVHRDLKEGESGHLVVLTGYEDGRIFYNDPDSKKRKDIERSVSLHEFLNGWKKRIIVIHDDECNCVNDQ